MDRSTIINEKDRNISTKRSFKKGGASRLFKSKKHRQQMFKLVFLKDKLQSQPLLMRMHSFVALSLSLIIYINIKAHLDLDLNQFKIIYSKFNFILFLTLHELQIKLD